jgi:hypothetical protein
MNSGRRQAVNRKTPAVSPPVIGNDCAASTVEGVTEEIVRVKEESRG